MKIIPSLGCADRRGVGSSGLGLAGSAPHVFHPPGTSGPAWACSSQGSGKGTKPRQILANLPEAETQNWGIHLLFVLWTHQICVPLRTLALLSAWRALSADPRVPHVSAQELLGWAFPTTQPEQPLLLGHCSIVPCSSFLKQCLVSVWKCLCVYLMSPLSLSPPQYVRSVGGGFVLFTTVSSAPGIEPGTKVECREILFS